MKRTIEADLLTDIMLMVFRINGRLLDGGDRLGAPLNLTSARWQVLGAISLSSASVTVPAIAEMMGMTRQGAQKQVNKLEEDGFIEKRTNPRHQRSPFYVLTPQGAESYARITDLHTGWANRLANGLDAPDLRAALALLNSFDQRLALDATESEERT
ncbi:DNA-binding MarR family transcriptional regulator [Rhizobium sp. BK650]|uniref:MarR family winged helix-turn-helix transcriptional regulator n=1 Tax=Rhizobium sp. BK650 TaxID=2586990 RepID=UPI00160BF908|nr:MarR family transcriptional regulator [Rhizobium sp. BK650]MBB3658243.1 DNA-binding MarR family transcriptional regulator [Rhizobium sp. BK650]